MDRHPITCTGSDRAAPRARRHRTATTAFVFSLVAALSLIVAPTASAAQPTRTVLTPTDYVVPAGFGCAFDVQVQYDAGYRFTRFEFSDGRVTYIGGGEKTLTNLESGATFTWQNNYRRTEVYDPATNDLVVDNSGRIALEYWPGDVDHTGQVVGESGAWYGYVGHLQGTFDFDIGGAITSASLNGTAVDLCALLAG